MFNRKFTTFNSFTNHSRDAVCQSEKMNKEINECDECNSEYYKATSEMTGLCPECSLKLYGYKNCSHKFEDDRCIKCYWNGKTSEFLD